MRSAPLAPLLAAALFASASLASDFDWAPAQEESVVEILTTDADGGLRETPVWIVVLEDTGYVRTNDSTWLANIRRRSPVRLRVGDEENAMRATEVADAALRARVEEAFKAKYGWLQRAMSALRMREPTVLALTPRGEQ